MKILETYLLDKKEKITSILFSFTAEIQKTIKTVYLYFLGGNLLEDIGRNLEYTFIIPSCNVVEYPRIDPLVFVLSR